MLVKEAHKQSVIHIELFPEEILSEVLRHATWVPYGINPSDMIGGALHSSYSKDLTRKYRTSLVTRRYLVQVCKKWRRLAFLYLYEWVRADRLGGLRGIIERLEQRHFGDSSACVGSCTRRLDIFFKWPEEDTSEILRQHEHLVLRLLRAVPNLLVLTVGAYCDPIWAIPSSSSTYCPKLEFFNWASGGRGVFEPKTWMHFVQSHPNLIGINMPTTGFPLITQTPPTHALKELTSGILCPIPVNSVFTSLHRLNIEVFESDERTADRTWYRDLMTQPLPSVTTLQLSFTRGTNDLDYNFETIERLFQFLPNLHRVDIVLLSWRPLRRFRYIFPSSVSTLGLRVNEAKPERRTINRLLRKLNHFVQSALSPLRVQFLDGRTMQSVCMHEEYVVQNARAGDVLQSWLDPDSNVYNLHI